MTPPPVDRAVIAGNTLRVDLDPVPESTVRVVLLGPGVTAEVVTYQGEVVTHNGQPVYVFVED